MRYTDHAPISAFSQTAQAIADISTRDPLTGKSRGIYDILARSLMPESKIKMVRVRVCPRYTSYVCHEGCIACLK